MPEYPNNQDSQIVENISISPENKAYSGVRRIALISTVILIILILITLLYLNGKSLYEHGL